MTTTRTLYRAADDDYLSDCASFAADREDAEAYLDNPGFGGSTLLKTTVEVDDDAVLDIRSSRDDAQVQSLLDAIDSYRDPCGASVDSLLGEPSVVEALVARGYHWVRLTDSYPEGAETWTWLGAGDEPELTKAEG
jgi:hypothetical protein